MLNKDTFFLILLVASITYYFYQREDVQDIYQNLVDGKHVNLQELKRNTLKKLSKKNNTNTNLNKEDIRYYNFELRKYNNFNDIISIYGYSISDLENCETSEVGYDIKSEIECDNLDYGNALYNIVTEGCHVEYHEYDSEGGYYPEYALGEINCGLDDFGVLFKDICEAEGEKIQCVDRPIHPTKGKIKWVRETLPVDVKRDILKILASQENRSNKFKGFSCSGDCSGHKAGYIWAKNQRLSTKGQCTGKSQSFIEGCWAFIYE